MIQEKNKMLSRADILRWIADTVDVLSWQLRCRSKKLKTLGTEYAIAFWLTNIMEAKFCQKPRSTVPRKRSCKCWQTTELCSRL